MNTEVTEESVLVVCDENHNPVVVMRRFLNNGCRHNVLFKVEEMSFDEVKEFLQKNNNNIQKDEETGEGKK